VQTAIEMKPLPSGIPPLHAQMTAASEVEISLLRPCKAAAFHDKPSPFCDTRKMISCLSGNGEALAQSDVA
jgi:hypothetical protein